MLSYVRLFHHWRRNRSKGRWWTHHGHWIKNRWRTHSRWCHKRIHHWWHVRRHVWHPWTWRSSHVRRWYGNSSGLVTRRWPSEWIVCYLARLECCCGGINQMLRLFLHPLLIVKLHIVAMLAACAMCFTHRGRIVRQICIAVIAVVLWHADNRELQVFS